MHHTLLEFDSGMHLNVNGNLIHNKRKIYMYDELWLLFIKTSPHALWCRGLQNRSSFKCHISSRNPSLHLQYSRCLLSMLRCNWPQGMATIKSVISFKREFKVKSEMEKFKFLKLYLLLATYCLEKM